jgi:F420-0:gamma-glutamyl ligase-like protein
MTRYYALALHTKFWMPRTDYAQEVVDAIACRVTDGDYVIVSEKAISTAQGNLLNEAAVKPSLAAKVLAEVWMPIAWGYFFGVVCHLGNRLLRRLRDYPAEAGSCHKQVALQHGGFLQALLFGSEGAIDGSNLPYSLVSLPLKNAQTDAETIRSRIRSALKKRVIVIIVDTDKTYSFGNFHFTPRPNPMKGISGNGAAIAYMAGRAFKLRKRPTPLAVAGIVLSADEALTVANVADRARGPGSGATVWDMAARFKVKTADVTWKMLYSVKHKPVVIVRKAPKA